MCKKQFEDEKIYHKKFFEKPTESQGVFVVRQE